MSGKHFNPMEDPPTASSSSEEDVEGSSSSEEEEDLAPSSKKAHKPMEKEQVSDSESGTEEESESESEPVVAKQEKPVKTKDPVVVKKKEDSKKVKSSEKPVTKTSEKPSKKRSSETTDDSKDAKKAKKVSSGEEENKKSEETKKYFQRLWSEEDEIAALQGFIDYITEKKVNPFEDSNAFYQSTKESISFDVSKTQFVEKVRNLKKKFVTNLGKGKNGEEPIFAKAHDRKAFQMSKLIWGDNGLAPESAAKSNVKSKQSGGKKVSKQELVSSLLNGKSSEEEEGKGGEELGSSSFLVKSLSRFGVDDLAAKQGWSRLSPEDKKRFEEQWNSLQQKEFELYSKKSGFIQEVVAKIAEAFQSNP